MNEKISIAMCTYNGERYLKEQLLSMCLQSEMPDELVVVDDCSTDNTIAILEEFRKTAPFKVLVHVNDSNLGFIVNFEKAINLCEFDIVMLCDQDDVWHTDKIKLVSNSFRQDHFLGLVAHDSSLLINNRQSKLTLWDVVGFNYFLKKYHNDHNQIIERVLIKGNVCPGHTMAFRKKMFNYRFISSVNKSLPHDHQILIYFLVNHQVKLLPTTLVNYRIHDKQAVGISMHKKQENIIDCENTYGKKSVLRWIRTWISEKKYVGYYKNHSLELKLKQWYSNQLKITLIQTTKPSLLVFLVNYLRKSNNDKIVYKSYLQLNRIKLLKRLAKSFT